jgi:hypothetical protein
VLVLQVNGTVSQSSRQEHGYRNTGQVGRRRGSGLWRVSSAADDAALVAEARSNPFASARELKAATNFRGQKRTVISRLKEAGLRARHAAVKDVLSDEHELYCLRGVPIDNGNETYSLANLHLAQQMMGPV